MLKYRDWTAAGCIVLVLSVGACSSDKVLPKGKRISVLEQASTIKPDVANGADLVKISEAANGSQWLQVDYSAQHIIPHINTDVKFKKQWSSGFGSGRSKRDMLLSRPIIDKKSIYTLDAEGMLSAYNIEDGERIWRVELTSDNSNVDDTALKGAGMAMENGVIYVTTGFGAVVALKSSDGSTIWENNLKTPLRIAPVVVADKVFVQSADNKFFALEAKNGEIVWDYDIALENTTVIGGPAPAYSKALDVVICGFSNGDIQAFNASLGTPLWSDGLVSNRQVYSSTYLHAVKASPVVEGETAYVLGSADVLAAIDIRSGSRIWEKEVGGNNTPLLSGNTLFLVSNSNDLLAVNKKNGDILWAVPIELGGKATEVSPFTPILLNGRLVLALSNGRVIEYNPRNGQKINMVDLETELNSAPIAANGYVIFTTANAKLIAYK